MRLRKALAMVSALCLGMGRVRSVALIAASRLAGVSVYSDTGTSMIRNTPSMADDRVDLPGSIRAVIPHPFGGAVAMAGFPGLETAVDGTAVFDPALCLETVQGLHDRGARHLTVLVEQDELDPLGFDLLARTCAAVGLTLSVHPIVDFSAPNDAMAQWWQSEQAVRKAALEGGATLAYCCQHGAGRSGLMASLCLMDAGIPADAAIALVRSHFAEAVESDEQEAWLKARSGA